MNLGEKKISNVTHLGLSNLGGGDSTVRKAWGGEGSSRADKEGCDSELHD